MTLYTELQSVAGELIAEYGAAATLKRQAAGAYDPATSSAAITVTSQPVQAVVFDYEAKFVNGTEIRTGDKQAYLSAVGITKPMTGDVLTWAAVDYTVVKVKPLAPSGTVAVFFELQVRS